MEVVPALRDTKIKKGSNRHTPRVREKRRMLVTTQAHDTMTAW